MERTVNHLYKDIERQDGAEEAGRVVTNMLKISKCVQNNAFNGNACRKIINNWHLFYEVLPVNLKPLAEGVRLLNIVVVSCFGQKLEENLSIYSEFGRSLQAADIRLWFECNSEISHIIHACPSLL